MKERVTLTIDNDILENIDSRVDGTQIKNRSHAVELLLMKALSSNRLRKGVILAGGEKKNTSSETITIMARVQDKNLIEWNVKLLKRNGVKEVLICIPKDNIEIREYFGNGDKLGVPITYLEEEYPLGTAGSIKAAAEFVTETTVVCYPDDLKKVDLDDMYEFHKINNKACTIALTTVEDPSRFGVALMNGSKILTFVEKPSKESAPSKLINSGVYIIQPSILKFIPEGFSSVETDVFPKLARDEELVGYVFSGQWMHIANKKDLEIAEKEWKGIK